MTTGQPSPTQHSPTKSEQGWVVTGPVHSPRQGEVTSQEQRAQAGTRESQRQVTCSIGPKSVQGTGLEGRLPALSL